MLATSYRMLSSLIGMTFGATTTEALFKPEPIETIIPIAPEAQTLIRLLVDQFAAYDWASFTDDVLGSIFEHLIPHDEQILFGGPILHAPCGRRSSRCIYD